MKIIISDYKNMLEKEYGITYSSIQSILPETEIKVIPFEEQDIFWSEMNNAQGLITAFLPVNENFLKKCYNLKCISLSATGYGNVNLNAAKMAGIDVCHVAEYCTEEVTEHTLALILALNRNIKYYQMEIEQNKKWRYQDISGGRPLSEQSIGIFGFGKIGKTVAMRAKAFDMKILAVDPFLSKEITEREGVRLVDADTAFAECDIISNHMNLTNENYHYFNNNAFHKMKKKPLFINVGRGACVDENALIRALDEGCIRGAGLDVLEEENPDLNTNSLLKRSNVILTPHSAFYSDSSIRKLKLISGKNLAYCLAGKPEKSEKLIVY